MLTKKMEEALNSQIQKEMYSAYLYMAMSADCSDKGLAGFATWLMVQYHEEMFHAMKIYEFIDDRNGRPIVPAIQQPPKEWNTALTLFEEVLAHEETVTASINDLMATARSENDNASQTFIEWYVTEQIEEEKNADDIIKKIKLAGEKGPGLYMLDKEVGARTLTAPADFSLGGLNSGAVATGA
jgi:ferritin